jgi:hypothetical protein
MDAALNRTFVLRDETHARRLWAFLRANWLPMAQAGKPLAVAVTEHKAKRSNDQNRLYWVLLADIAESAWVDGRRYSKEQWHAHFAGEFIGWEELPGGRRSPISTTTLSVPEFTTYLERVMQYAAEELGVETCTA